MTDILPLVSCIMPTAERRSYVPHAIRYFLNQDYPHKELIILDDGEDRVADLIPAIPTIRYFQTNRRNSIGAKRNMLCEEARGELIAHWDDDDWHAPQRLSVQIEALLNSGKDICGITRLLFFSPGSNRAWEYQYPAAQRVWLSGSTLLFRRDLWKKHRFRDINVGEDTTFVWGLPPNIVHILEDNRFHIGIIHGRNTSPKRVGGNWWKEIPLERIHDLLGKDIALYTADVPVSTAVPEDSRRILPTSSVRPLRNIFACLVHEAQDCVIDLIRNLHHLDPTSVIILYNGSTNAELLSRGVPFERYGAIVHTKSRVMKWGRLHDFALDCMRFALQSVEFDTMTIVDSDQLGLRGNYSEQLSKFLNNKQNVGLLGNNPGVLRRNTKVAPAVTAWKEFNLWRPFLRQFTEGEEKWVHWSFWPSTILTVDACRALVDLFDNNRKLNEILNVSKLWASEEILFPTLTALLGYRILSNPFSYDYVKYRTPYSNSQLRAALGRSDVYWMHPVPRSYNNNLRCQIRNYFDHYQGGASVQTDDKRSNLFLTLPVLSDMKRIEGWLEEDEADLLIAAVQSACRLGHEGGSIVEIGSYCGRSTVVLARTARFFAEGVMVYAIDPHDGKVGAVDQGLQSGRPTLQRFQRNITNAGVAGIVELIQKRSWEVHWSRPISFLFIDGLHDYVSVARDFRHFASWVVEGGYVAFHDYADYYPGVKAFVNELLADKAFELVHCVRSLIVLQCKTVIKTPTPVGSTNP